MRKIKEWTECPYATQALVGSYYCTHECKYFFGETIIPNKKKNVLCIKDELKKNEIHINYKMLLVEKKHIASIK